MRCRSLLLFVFSLIFVFSTGVAAAATISGTLALDGSLTGNGHVNIWNTNGDPVDWIGTDPSGHWTSNDLPGDTYFVTAGGEDVGFVSELYDNRPCPWEACDVTQGDPVVLTDAGVTGIAFDLERPDWRLRGSILDGDGNPVGGGVRIYHAMAGSVLEAWTSEHGKFESEPLPDGTYFAVTMHTFGMQDEAWDDVSCVNQMCDVAQVGTPIVVDGADVEGLDFVLAPIVPGGHIEGQVSGPDGPLAGVWMEVRNARGEVLHGVPTDYDGFYRTELLADDIYFVVAQNERLGLAREIWDDVPCMTFWDCGDAWYISNYGDEIEVSGADRPDIDFELALPPGGVVSGQVVDAGTGFPVPAIGLVLIDAVSGEFLRWTGTDWNGEYYFSGLAPGQYKILAEGVPDGYLPELYGGDQWPCELSECGATVEVEFDTSVVSGNDIFLDFEGARIVGQITRSDTGEPVSGAIGHVGVELFNSSGEGMGGVVANEAGYYEIRLEGGGDFYLVGVNDVERHHLINEVWYDIPCFEDCHPFSVPGATLVTVGEGETFIANFELDPGYRISGSLAFEGQLTGESYVTVWNSDGQPVAHAWNDGEGHWMTPPLPPGTWYVSARGEDFERVSEVYDDQACPWEACDVTQGDPISVTDADVTGIAFDLRREERLYHLSGTILDSAEAPVGGAVRLFNPLGQPMNEYWTDEFGQFQSEPLANGTYYLVTAYTNGMQDEAWDDVACVNLSCDIRRDATPIVIQDDHVGGLDFVLEPITSGGAIGGQVTGPDGPLANVSMEIRNANGDFLFGFPTDKDGFYRTWLLSNDSYFVVAQTDQFGLRGEVWDDVLCDPFWLCGDPWFVRDHGTAIVLEGSDRDDIDFELDVPPGGMISGQLVDAGTGLPVPGVGMTLFDADTGDFLRGAGANWNGEFYFSGLEPGNYKVLAEGVPPGYEQELYGGDHWPCDLATCGAVVRIEDATTVAPETDVYLDFEGTRFVGQLTRGDTGEPVSGLDGFAAVGIFNANGEALGDAPVNEAGRYEILLDGFGDFYLLAFNEMDRHHLVNEVWYDIPCIDHCEPAAVRGAIPITLAVGETRVMNFELAALVPPAIERRALVHPSAVIGENVVIEENVVVHEDVLLGIGVYVVKNVEIGERCMVGHFARIDQNAILGPDCTFEERADIGKGAWLGARVHVGHDSIVGKDARIGDDVHIGNNVELGKNVVVHAGLCIPDGTVIPKDGVVDMNLCP